MRMMALAMFVFLVAIAVATFLESMYGTQTAKIIVYNAKWFEILLFYLGLNLIANIFRYKLLAPQKISILMFHLAFIVMLVGAFVTRYFGQEGMMIIKEGSAVNYMYSADPYVWYRVNDGSKQYTHKHLAYMTPKTWFNDFEAEIEFPGHKNEIEMEYVDYHENMVDSLIQDDKIQNTVLNIVTNGMQSNYLQKEGFVMVGENAISFGKKNAMPGIEVSKVGRRIMMRSQLPMSSVSMAAVRASGGQNIDSLKRIIPMDTLIPFETATLYMLGDGSQFVFKEILDHAEVRKMSSPVKNAGVDILKLKLIDGDQEKIVELKGGKDAIPEREVFEFNGLQYEMEYGSVRLDVPFSILCRDFQLDHYPGSSSPSSFASEVTVIDDSKDYKKDHRIFMNNVLDYDGFRFFQSSYEPDLSGTRLSVNRDWWGTNISYLGYLMMAIGMLMSLFAGAGRMRELIRLLVKAEEKKASIGMVVALGLFTSFSSFSQDSIEEHDHADHSGHSHEQTVDIDRHAFISQEESDKLARLQVQDFSGRIIPMHTFADQVLRKVSRSNKYNDYNAVQTVMSMHMYPMYWLKQPIIYVSSKGGWREKLKIEGSHISYEDLTNMETGEFKLLEEYKKAHQMREARRGEEEKQLIKLADKYEVFGGIITWRNMKILPLKGAPNNEWFSPATEKARMEITDGYMRFVQYYNALDSAALGLSNYDLANTRLQRLMEFQIEAGNGVALAKDKVEMEIRYNKMNIFSNSYKMYLLLGFVILVIFFFRVFIKPSSGAKKVFKIVSIVLGSLTAIAFLYHGYGIYMRAMISGHAPWSNGYEAMIYIAWITVLCGLFFIRKYPVILSGALILASFMIIVTEMNLMDPEITPLVPVLKSYWLMIHVAIITGSYAPLGLAFMLGLINLVMYVFRNEKNGKIVTLNINQLTYVAEMLMTVGVFMLTIGTFLGGVWANESWGRYWGWDPKETWALVSILCYAIILHFRFIKGLKSKFALNLAAFWGYSTILFTFFGVNFMLVGLHSYAQGDGLPGFPTWLTITIFVFLGFTVLSGLRYRAYNKKLMHEK